MTTDQHKEFNNLIKQKDWDKTFRFIRSCWKAPGDCVVDHRSIHEGPHLVLEALDTTGKNGKTRQIVSEHPVIVPYVSRVKSNYLRLAVPAKELHL